MQMYYSLSWLVTEPLRVLLFSTLPASQASRRLTGNWREVEACV